ncbi:MAG: response regulator transcription factor [Propionicimonas sp.]
MAGRTISVLVVDDDLFVRQTLAEYLAATDDLVVAGVCADGAEAVEAARALRPDVALMDLRMPLLDGFDATRLILQVSPATRVLALTSFDDEDAAAGILRAGGTGYLLKSTRPQVLADAVRAAHGGITVLPADMVRRLAMTGEAPAAQPRLTRREHEVLAALRDGLTTAEIARDLFVSASTVKADLRSLTRKLGARNRAQLAAKAYELRLLDGPPR